MSSVAMTSHIGATQHDKTAKSNTISTGGDLANVEKHNNHDYTEQDVSRMQSSIDLSMKVYNKQYDRDLNEVDRLELVSSVKDIYHEEFDAAVAEYNQIQIEKGRPQRQISDYFESISDNEKQEVAVEGLIQIGDYADWKGTTIEEKLRVVPILEAGLGVIAAEIPGFKIAGASLHMNEGSPHIHYVGVCVDESEKKKGMNKRIGKSAVFTRKVMSEILQNRMREVMEPMVKETYGWDFKIKKGGRNEDLSKNEYVNMKLQEENKELQAHQDRLKVARELHEAEIARLRAEKIKMEEEAFKAAQEAVEAAQEAQDARLEIQVMQHDMDILQDDLNDAQQLLTDYHREMQIADEQWRARQEYYSQEIQGQTETLQLIQDYDEYITEADTLEQNLDLLETAAEELPDAKRLFKASEAESFLQRMNQILQDIRKLIGFGIKRLKIYESNHAVDEKLSGPIEQRAESLDGRIFGASGRAGTFGPEQTKERSW